MIILHRNQIQQQTSQNMVEAGVLKPEETEMFIGELQQLNLKDLITVLLESHDFREQAVGSIQSYPIGEVSLN